jgi:hypothetical protein
VAKEGETMAEFSPAAMEAAINQIIAGAGEVAHMWAPNVQDRMRSEARWHDQGGKDSATGLTARESLDAQVDATPDEIRIVARSTRETRKGAPVGAFLELGTRFMGRYDVIWPVLTTSTEELKSQLEAMLHADL